MRQIRNGSTARQTLATFVPPRGNVRARENDHPGRMHRARAITPRSKSVSDQADPVLQYHAGGKITVNCKSPIASRELLSMAYTPGVGQVSTAIARQPDQVWALTIKRNAVAVVTDGTAVLGLGDLGPEAALPVMEGKAMLLKQFGGIDAYPICLRALQPSARDHAPRSGQARGHRRHRPQ